MRREGCFRTRWDFEGGSSEEFLGGGDITLVEGGHSGRSALSIAGDVGGNTGGFQVSKSVCDNGNDGIAAAGKSLSAWIRLTGNFDTNTTNCRLSYQAVGSVMEVQGPEVRAIANFWFQLSVPVGPSLSLFSISCTFAMPDSGRVALLVDDVAVE